jgi:hypothetical protein
MKILIDIPDDKANALLEVLHDISYVKVIRISEGKTPFKEELKEAIDEVGLIKSGKKNAQDAVDFLNNRL